MDFVTPVGFRDILPDEALQREQISQRVMACFTNAGYMPIETPTLERMDAMDAAGRIPGKTFKLFDATGELLALRPDVTMQVARIAATRMREQGGVARYRYMQRVFRDVDLQFEAREMTQMGIEYIGEGGAEADAEVVGLFAQALQLAGLERFTIALGTVGVLRALLEACKVDGAWKNAVLAAYHASNFVDLDELCSQDGVPAKYAQAIATLPRIRGGREAIDAARDLVAPLDCVDGLDAFAQTYDALAQAGLADALLVDFSIMSSFDYYTGIVFEAYAPGMGELLGSGGRYDTMLESLGAEARPAAGFSFYLEQVMEGAANNLRNEQGTDSTLSARLAHQASENEQNLAPSSPLRIAVPKGSLNEGTIAALSAAGLDTTGLDNPGRQLIISNPGVDYIIVRPTDAPAFVALGAADCGICGEDSLLETGANVVELVDLRFGACRFIVAQPAGTTEAVEERYRKLGSMRIATKYPNITRRFFERQGTQVEIVELRGNIELAPMVGMAERIVDITATGTTLRENDLEIVDEVLECTARFFANTAAFRMDGRVVELARALKESVCEE
ncbi:MAG: ATP phosphoribosyltransferase regulatory subunit [Eggerthellaceae bacterium]|nr:ATP phosphoribosyltransferase regulatory subunit [Eggerthellaceae bacterium]